MASLLFWAAALLALIFASNLVSRYRAKKSPFYLWWSISFFLYVIAFGMEALTVSSNWNSVFEYQLYIIGSAGLVGAMSVGTTYLALPKTKVAVGYAVYFVLVEVLLAIFAFVNPPVLHGSWATLNAGKNAIVGTTHIFYLLLAAVGGPIVLIGALWSWWKTRRYYNLLIALGALVPSSAGTLASQGIATAIFPVMNIIGLVLIFWGYVYSRSSGQGRVNQSQHQAREA
jgi:hypothetical protein